MISRRLLVASVGAVVLAGCQKKGPSGAPAEGDMSLGNPKAKVTVVEYASVGCPVCAGWQREVWPAFKAKYVDTGKVHYIFREMLVGGDIEVRVAANGFVLARCAGADKYFPVVDAIFANQEQAFQTPRETLENIAKSVGMTTEQFNACVEDHKAVDALNERVERHSRGDGVNATPTFVINGKAQPAGPLTLQQLDALIAAADKA